MILSQRFMTLTNEEYVNKNKNYILYIFFLKINLGKIKKVYFIHTDSKIFTFGSGQIRYNLTCSKY